MSNQVLNSGAGYYFTLVLIIRDVCDTEIQPNFIARDDISRFGNFVQTEPLAHACMQGNLYYCLTAMYSI